MVTEANPLLSKIFETWQAEDRELEACLDEVRDWMREVSQLGIPHFGETATRLRPFHDRLVLHFDREDKMIGQLAQHYPSSSPEVSAVRTQSDHDHKHLLVRLDDLMARLNQTEPPFASWQAAMEEVELFVDVLEQHEERESESIKILMPSEPHRLDSSKSS
jgi:hemerythrin-like domain-containing protein